MEEKNLIKRIFHSNSDLQLRSLFKDSEKRVFNKQSILVIDEDYLAETLKSILLASNYLVVIASSGVQAIRNVSQNTYSLVLIEEKLPDSTGIKIAHLIKSLSHETKIILMTRNDDWRETLLIVPEEIDFILLKPFPPEILIAAVESVLKKDLESIPPIRLPLA